MAKAEALVLGVDFGTDSVRAALFDAADGSQFGSAVAPYTRWAKGLHCDPRESRYRQHPLDYLEGLEVSVRAALAAAGKRLGGEAAPLVRGLAIDTTGSTPCLADPGGRPLALDPALADDPDACFVLWKDHCAVAEAADINAAARSGEWEDYTKYEGGAYSSEWFWAKALRLARRRPDLTARAATFVEHCDWMPALLTGASDHSMVARSRCAMGHKAMWHASWGGYPGRGFLGALHPWLATVADSLGAETVTADRAVGGLCGEWAGRLGLPAGLAVAAGALDAHVGALGGGVGPGTLLKIMGTSTCDIMVGPRPGGNERLVAGICGQVDGSVIPGMTGYEAGQSAYGDLFAWFRDLVAWPLLAMPGIIPTGNARVGKSNMEEISRRAHVDAILPALELSATDLEPGAGGLVALDWLNGRRTPDADQSLRGAIAGLSLGTDAPSLYRALVEAAAYGSRAIVERLREQGVAVERVSAVGGVAKKSRLAMQVLSDVLGMPIAVQAGDQACALGAAMLASVAAGLHGDIGAAQAAMGAQVEKVYTPDPARSRAYDGLYARYQELGRFERETRGGRSPA